MDTTRRKQKCIIVQSCRNCSEHSYHTHHQESKYQQFVSDIQKEVSGKFGDVLFLHNQMKSSQIDSLNMLHPDRQADTSGADFLPLRPRVGSFQIFFNSFVSYLNQEDEFLSLIQCIFSKLKSGMWPSIPQVSKKLEKLIQNYEQSKDITEFTVDLNKVTLRGQRAPQNSKMRSSSRLSSYSPSPLRGSFNASRSKKQLTPVRQSQSPIRLSNKKPSHAKGSFRQSGRNEFESGASSIPTKYKNTTQNNSPYRQEQHRAESEVTTHPPYIDEFKNKKNVEDEPAKPQFQQKDNEEEKKKIEDDLMNRSIISEKKLAQKKQEDDQLKPRASAIESTRTPVEEQKSQNKPVQAEPPATHDESRAESAAGSQKQDQQQEDYQKDQETLPPIEALNSQSSQKEKEKTPSNKDQSAVEANKNNQSAYQDDYSQEFDKSMQQGKKQNEEDLIDAQFSQIKPIEPGNQDHLQIRASLDLNDEKKEQENGQLQEITHNLHESMDKNDQPSVLPDKSMENNQSHLLNSVDDKKQQQGNGQILEIYHNQHESMDRNDQPSALAQTPMGKDQSQLLKQLDNTKNGNDQVNNSMIDENQIKEDNKQIDLPQEQEEEVKKDEVVNKEQKEQGEQQQQNADKDIQKDDLNSSKVKDQTAQQQKDQILNESQIKKQPSQKGENETLNEEEPRTQAPNQVNEEDKASEDQKQVQPNQEQNENAKSRILQDVQEVDKKSDANQVAQEQNDKVQEPQIEKRQQHNETKQGNSLMDQTVNSQASALAKNMTDRVLNSAKESLRNEDQIESQMSKITQVDRAQSKPENEKSPEVEKSQQQQINESYITQAPSLNAVVAKDLTEKALKTAKQSLINQGQIQSQVSMMSQDNKNLQQSKVIYNTEHNDSIRMGQEENGQGQESKFGPNFGAKKQDQGQTEQEQEPEKDMPSDNLSKNKEEDEGVANETKK